MQLLIVFLLMAAQANIILISNRFRLYINVYMI